MRFFFLSLPSLLQEDCNVVYWAFNVWILYRYFARIFHPPPNKICQRLSSATCNYIKKMSFSSVALNFPFHLKHSSLLRKIYHLLLYFILKGLLFLKKIYCFYPTWVCGTSAEWSILNPNVSKWCTIKSRSVQVRYI